MKMYILMVDDIPSGLAVNAVAHASLACYLKFQDDPLMKEWLEHSFKKVTCKISRRSLARAMETLPDSHVKITESALDGELVGAAFCPQDLWPDHFRTLPLYK